MRVRFWRPVKCSMPRYPSCSVTMSSAVYAVTHGEYSRVALSKRGICVRSRWSHRTLNIGSSPHSIPLRRRVSRSRSEDFLLTRWKSWCDWRIHRALVEAIGFMIALWLHEDTMTSPDLSVTSGGRRPATHLKRLASLVIKQFPVYDSAKPNQIGGSECV